MRVDGSVLRRERAAKPRLLVVNQYYWPGVEATAHLLTELCEALTDEYEIRVLTGVLHGHEQLPRREVRNGVRDRARAVDRLRARHVSACARSTTPRTSAARCSTG